MSSAHEDLWIAVRLAAEGSDWKRDSGETLVAWAQRKLSHKEVLIEASLLIERRRDVLTQLSRHAEAAAFESVRQFFAEKINS